MDTKMATIEVKDIFLDSNVAGKKVTVEGKISSQCGSNGCWFVLQDDTGQIFINLGPNNMTHPPRMNRTSKVTGIVIPVLGYTTVMVTHNNDLACRAGRTIRLKDGGQTVAMAGL